MDQAQPLKVYWRPGCSSCVKVKEFLSRLGVDFESVNVSARPEAMDELLALGVRTVLTAAQRHVLQIPPERLAERATGGRDRSVLDLAYHVHQVPDSFLQAVENGVQDLTSVYNRPPPAHVTTVGHIRDYGVSVLERLNRWWEREGAANAASAKLDTYYGEQRLHHVMERCTWHSAQHARQIVAVLERFGIPADGPLTRDDYAGLPMPDALWE